MMKIQCGLTSVIAASFAPPAFVFDGTQLQLNIPRSSYAGVALVGTVPSAFVNHILSTAVAHHLISSTHSVKPTRVVHPEWRTF